MTIVLDKDNEAKAREFKRRFNDEKNNHDCISKFTGKGRLTETFQNIVNEAFRRVTYEELYYEKNI